MLIGLAHSRIGEVSMALGLGEEARRRVIATLPVMEEAGARFTVARLRIMLMVTHLMCGATDEAEHLLAQMAPGEEAASSPMVESLVRAEILLARGQIEAGLSLLRRAADQLGNRHIPASDSELLGGDSWTFHVQAVTVVAHAQHGRLDLVEEIVDCLPDALSRVIAGATDLSLCGALILALAATDIDKGRRNGDAHVVSSAARMIALAERLGFQQEFQPTMSPERARQTAEQADESAYADSRSAYAGLGSDELMAAALEALRARPRLIGQDHA